MLSGSQGLVCVWLPSKPLQAPYGTQAKCTATEGDKLFGLPQGRGTDRWGSLSYRISETRAHCISSSAKCSLTLRQLSSQHPKPAFPDEVMHRHTQMQRLFKHAIYWQICTG